MSRASLALALLAWSGAIVHAGDESSAPAMQPFDVFQLEAAYDPRIAPDGDRVLYVRHGASAKDDRWHDELWCIDTRTGEQRPLASSSDHAAQPRWSPDGRRVAYVSIDDGSRTAVILAANYGEAGAIDRFGPSRGLPPAYSGHNSYADVRVPPGTTGPVLVVGYDDPSDLLPGCRPLAPIVMPHDIDTEEQGRPMWACDAPTRAWAELWPDIRHVD